jgi:hypothetical protein
LNRRIRVGWVDAEHATIAIHITHVTAATVGVSAHHSAHVIVAELTHVLRVARHYAGKAHWLDAILWADEGTSDTSSDSEADEAVTDDYTG